MAYKSITLSCLIYFMWFCFFPFLSLCCFLSLSLSLQRVFKEFFPRDQFSLSLYLPPILLALSGEKRTSNNTTMMLKLLSFYRSALLSWPVEGPAWHGPLGSWALAAQNRHEAPGWVPKSKLKCWRVHKKRAVVTSYPWRAKRSA